MPPLAWLFRRPNRASEGGPQRPLGARDFVNLGHFEEVKVVTGSPSRIAHRFLCLGSKSPGVASEDGDHHHRPVALVFPTAPADVSKEADVDFCSCGIGTTYSDSGNDPRAHRRGCLRLGFRRDTYYPGAALQGALATGSTMPQSLVFTTATLLPTPCSTFSGVFAIGCNDRWATPRVVESCRWAVSRSFVGS